MRLSVVVPCYNEQDNIPLILERFDNVVNRDDVEVILVDNGSTDHSDKVLSELLPSYPFARSIKVDVNQGYGLGILSGLHRAKGEFIGWTHADMQTDPNDVIRALELLEQQPEPENAYAKGLRQGRGLAENFFTWGMSALETVYLGRRLWDINAQPNIFHRSFFDSWDDPPHDFSLDLYALYLASRRGLILHRFPVLFPERIHGHSHWNVGLAAKWKFIKRTIDFSIKLKRRLKRDADHRTPAQHGL